MLTERLRSRDGENQQSDQTSKQRDASPKSGQIRDFATYQYQIFESQRKGKAPADGKDCTRVGENDMPVEKLKLPDKSGLKGGMARDANNFLSYQQMEEYFEATNLPYHDRTVEQDILIKLVEKTEKIIEKYFEYDDDFIQNKVDRAKTRIYKAQHTNSSSSDNEAGPSHEVHPPEGIPENRQDQIDLLVDTLVNRYGQGDDWRNDEKDIRNYMWNNPMDGDDHRVC